MGSVSKERIWGETIRHAVQRARETRFIADVAACEAWNYRMQGYGGPAQPSPPIGDALNAGFRYLGSSVPAAARTTQWISPRCGDRGKRQSGNFGDARLRVQAWQSGSAAACERHDEARH